MMNNFKTWLNKVNQALCNVFLSVAQISVFLRQNINNNTLAIPLLSYETVQTSRFTRNITIFLVLFCSMLSSFHLKAQNAPLGCDKNYMIVSELPNAIHDSRSQIYPFGGNGAGQAGCTVGGGGEGIVVDPTKNVAYIATCCFQSKILVYDLAQGAYLTPILVPGQDLLDVVLSTDRKFLYVTSYQGVTKISTTTNTVVDIYRTNRLTNKDVGLWGVSVNPANGRVFVATNYFSGGGTSTIESVDSSYVGASTLFVTAPTGYNFRGINFAADGSLWAVASGTSGPDRLFHYNGTTGTLIGSFDFITPSITGTVGDVEAYDLAFGPDGNLYITTYYGDCVSKFNVTTNIFTTEIGYQAGEQGKSIAFVCGNLKCMNCGAPAPVASDITFTLGTCSGLNFVPNNDGTATISNLTFSATNAIEANIKEGTVFGTTPIFGAGSNKTLGSGQTSFTFTGLKPGTKYTVRIWSGNDACYNDVTFTTPDFSSKVVTSSGSILCGPGLGTLNATCPVGLVPQWYSSATSNVVIGTSNTFIFNASSTISFFVGCKANENHCGVATANRTQLTISVNVTPAAPLPTTVAGGLICGSGVLDLKATCEPGFTPVWYDSQSSVAILHTGSPYSVPVTVTKTYFASCKDLVSGCESPAGSRTPVIATFSTIPDAVITTSTLPVCVGTDVVLSVTPSASIYRWSGPNGFISPAQNPRLNNIQTSQGGIYSVEVSNGLCAATTMINLIVFDKALGITATATNSTCDQDLVKNDGTIKLAGFSSNLRYDISAGATYTGGKLYATSTAIPANGVLRSDVPNPTIVIQQYTVRVFNANDCFTDHTVTIQQVTCDCGVARCVPYTIIKTKSAVKKELIRTTSSNSGTNPDPITPTPSSKITIKNANGSNVLLNTNDLIEATDWLKANSITEDIIVQFNTSDTYLLDDTFAPTYNNGTNRVTFQGGPGVRPIFDGQKKLVSVWRFLQNYTTIKNLELRNADIENGGGAIIRADGRNNLKLLDIIVDFGYCAMRATTGVFNFEIDGFIVRNVRDGSFRINGENGLTNGNLSIKNIKLDHSTGQNGNIVGTSHGYHAALVLKFNNNWVVENVGSIDGEKLFDLGIIEESGDIKCKNIRGLFIYIQNNKNVSLINCYLPSKDGSSKSTYMSNTDGVEIIHSQIKFSDIYLCSNFRKIRGSVFLDGVRGYLNSASDVPLIEDNNLIVQQSNGYYIDFGFTDASTSKINDSNLANYKLTKGQNTLFIPLNNKAQVSFNPLGSLSESSLGKRMISTIIDQVTDDVRGVTRTFPTDVGPFNGVD